MNVTQTIQAQIKVYNTVYTITFRDGQGIDRWTREAQWPEAYGGRKKFVELSTTRDAEYFRIVQCTKA